MKPRKPLGKMGQDDSPPLQIAGKPAAVCPYCGAAMFKDGVNRTSHQIVRYVECRNKACGRRFLTSQPPEKIVRELSADGEDSANGKPSLTLIRESA